MTVRRSFRAARFAAQVSFAALVATHPSLAFAQCSPDPTQANTAVSCTGTDTNGIAITTNASPLTVVAGASVTNTGAPAISVSIPASPTTYYQRAATVTVNGTVAATGGAGLSIESGALGSAFYDYYGTSAAVTVGAAGSITGTTGIAATQTSGNPYSPTTLSLDNAGTISGTSGVALSTSGSYATFSSITNRATGTIGAIQANTSAIYNSGTIDGGTLSAIAPGTGFSTSYAFINNSGTITAAGTNATIANDAGTVLNSGTISNTGTGTVFDSSYMLVNNLAGGTITAGGASLFGTSGPITITNAGTIANTGTGTVAATRGDTLTVTNYAGGIISTTAGNTVLSASTSLNLVNKGSIIGNVVAGWGSATYGYNSTVDSTAGTITGNLTLGYGSDTLVATLKDGKLYTGVSGTIDGGEGTNTVQIKSTADATLSSALTLPTNFSQLDLAPTAGTTITLANGFSKPDALYFDGSGTLVNQTTLTGSSRVYNGQVIGQFGSSTGGTFRNEGTITTSNTGGNAAVTLTQGTVINTGTISATGTAVALNAGGTLTNSGTLTSSGGAAISTTYTYYTYTLNNLAGGVISGVGDAVQLGGGTVTNAGTINGNVNLGYSPYGGVAYVAGTYIANGGTLNGNLTFGGQNSLLIESGSGFGITGTVSGGSSNNLAAHLRSSSGTVTLSGQSLINFGKEFTLATGAATQVTLTGASGYTGAIIVGGDGKFINQMATTGAVQGMAASGVYYGTYYNTEIGGFSNRANVGSIALFAGNVDNSATIGSATLAGTALLLTTGKAFNLGNTGTIVNNGLQPAIILSGSTTANSTIANSGTITGGLSLSVASAPGNTVSLNNSGTITGNIALNAGTVALVNTGTINGNISTGSGNDSFAMNGAFAGSLNGGAGVNTLSVNGGTQSAPVAFTTVSNIATYSQSGGFATVSGTGTFGSAVLTGGRLVGLAGSVLNAGTFTVGPNATFGSAGTVNGVVNVNGTLSPGASPGTMTVNGNVALNSGSTSLFEITPTVSDKLIVNGTVAIASGSTLQIVASTPVKVGTTLDLIHATGGVSGSFTTVTGLNGIVRSLSNGDLGLLVQFTNPEGYNPQVRRAITYLNSAMGASSAPAALFPALSALQDGTGAPSAAAFAQVTPEPYADAMQIGTETALSLAGNARTIGDGETGGSTHLFGFGQVLGSMRQFASNEEQGVSHATINGFGMLGGLGVAGQDYAFSGYIGWMDQTQSVGTLGASTKSRGVVGGVAARFGGGATRITLSANRDEAHALTRRYVPDAGTISTSYALPSWSFDASISHALPLGQGWLLRPQVGTTWVMTSHDAITEASNHPFALTVDAASNTQGFVDAGLGFETAPDAKGPWRRFLTLGARYRVQGDQTIATAALGGYTSGLVALGVGRNRVDATMAAGVEYRLAPGASLFLNASGELGKESKRESVTAGMRFRL